MVLSQQKRTTEICRKVLWFCEVFLSWHAHLTMGSFWTDILRWKKTCLSFLIVIFFGVIVRWIFEYHEHQICCWVGRLWSRLHRQFLSQRRSPKSWSWAAPLTLLWAGWAGWFQGSFPTWAVILYQGTQFWINSAWQLDFCWHRYSDKVTFWVSCGRVA